MPSKYPQGIDTFAIPSNPANTPMSSSGDSDRNHVESHRDLGDAIEATQANMAVRDHDHSGLGIRATPKLLQANTHENADTDKSFFSIHHTLGTTSTNQAAPGDHTHDKTSGLGIVGSDNAVVNPTGEINNLWFGTPPYEKTATSLTIASSGYGPYFRMPSPNRFNLAPTEGMFLTAGSTYDFAVLHTSDATSYSFRLEIDGVSYGTFTKASGIVESGGWTRLLAPFTYTGPTKLATVEIVPTTTTSWIGFKDVSVRPNHTPPHLTSYLVSSSHTLTNSVHYAEDTNFTQTALYGPVSKSPFSIYQKSSTKRLLKVDVPGHYAITLSLAYTYTSNYIRSLMNIFVQNVDGSERHHDFRARLSKFSGHTYQTVSTSSVYLDTDMYIGVGSYVAGCNWNFTGTLNLTYLGV